MKVKSSPKVDLTGLLNQYKYNFTDRLLSSLLAIGLFIGGYIATKNYDSLPVKLHFISTIGAFLLAPGFCLLVLLFIAPLFNFVIKPLIIQLLDIIRNTIANNN